jgi:hypothetical protein
MPFLIQNNILAEAQNGFRKSKSTVTASQSFIASIQEALDSGLNVIGLFFDLSKAYDVIEHDIPLDKLESYGIRCVSSMWFRSYLLNWCQFVEIKNTDGSVKNSYNSTCRIVKYGVPQGSVLGPLLFLLYINDLTENVLGAKLVLYADNTNWLITGKDEDDLQCKIMYERIRDMVSI